MLIAQQLALAKHRHAGEPGTIGQISRVEALQLSRKGRRRLCRRSQEIWQTCKQLAFALGGRLCFTNVEESLHAYSFSGQPALAPAIMLDVVVVDLANAA